MLRLVATRLAAGLVTLLAASALIFVTVDLLPGDAATAFLGRDAASDPGAVAQLREEYGLDRPVLVRYADWVSGAVRFEFGESPANRQPVSDLIGPRLEKRLELIGPEIERKLEGLGPMLRQHLERHPSLLGRERETI